VNTSQQLEQDAERCKVAGVPFNPKLPRNFDDTPNESRPLSHRRWWGRPFICTETIDRMDAFYAGRTDDHAEAGRNSWAESRPQWLAAWPNGIRYDVRCLDGGAWDRSTTWGAFATLDDALKCAATGPSWRRR
jgi:hypothetical protein